MHMYFKFFFEKVKKFKSIADKMTIQFFFQSYIRNTMKKIGSIVGNQYTIDKNCFDFLRGHIILRIMFITSYLQRFVERNLLFS